MVLNSRKFVWEAQTAPSSGLKHRFFMRTTRLRPLSILLLAGSFFLVSCAAPTTSLGASGSSIATIVQIVDGDTVVVEFSNGQEETVRLLGIDTPETIDPARPVQCFGQEATAELTRLIPAGSTIRLERDVEARDRFGRLLSYVYRASDQLFINQALLEGGFADLSIYEPNTAYRSPLTAAVTSARTATTGLWGVCGGPDVPLDPSN